MFGSLRSSESNSDIIMGGYTQIPQKFYHPNAARHGLGLVGGNDVSIPSGNLVDLESDLFGITRDLSQAPAKKYKPSCPLGGNGGPGVLSNLPITGGCPAWPKPIVFMERSTGKTVVVNTTPRHLPTIQMFSYPGVPTPEPFRQEVYGAPWRF